MSISQSSKVREAPVSDDRIQRAIDYGIDISLIEANLGLTPLQRVEKHDALLNEALWLREQGKKFYGN